MKTTCLHSNSCKFLALYSMILVDMSILTCAKCHGCPTFKTVQCALLHKVSGCTLNHI